MAEIITNTIKITVSQPELKVQGTVTGIPSQTAIITFGYWFKGDDGADGKSAYEIWLDEGHTGTEEDFLNWLKADVVQSDWDQNDSTANDYIKNKPTIPIVHNPTIKIKRNGFDIGQFSLNQSNSDNINIVVPTNAGDVNALPSSTKYAASASLSIDSSTYVATLQLKDQDGNNIGSAQTIDLPLESVVVGGEYDPETKMVILTLENGQTVEFSVADLISGLQSEINAQNKLNADYVEDGDTNKVYTSTEKSKLGGIESGAQVNVQSDWDEEDSSDDAFIKNKPANLVQDDDYVHTDNNYTNEEKSKLSGIEAGAEVNVQSDWSQTDNTSKDYLKNMPNVFRDNPMIPKDGTIIENIVQDYDGNLYNGVVMNNKIILKENLRTRHYSDGTLIEVGYTSSETIPYCYYPNNDINNVELYGCLYNWAAVMNGESSDSSNPSSIQGISPIGFHIPSHNEWVDLFNYIATKQEYLISNDIGKAMSSKFGWSNSTKFGSPGNNPNSNNATNFTITPSGRFSSYNNTISNIGGAAYWWSCTEGNSDGIWYYYIFNYDTGIYKYRNAKDNAFSVRCIMDVSASDWFAANKNKFYLKATSNGMVWSQLELVAESGSYNDLKNKPSIPAAQVQSDWGQNDSSEVDFIKNKPNFATVATSGSYNDLLNKPTIPTIRTMNGEQLTDSSLGDINIHDGFYFPNAVQDYDGNWYGAVVIGKQVWLGENLRTTHYNDGTTIENIYNNTDSDISLEKRGLLYKYTSAVNNSSSLDTRIECMFDNWFVPTREDFNDLVSYLNKQKRFSYNEGDFYYQAKSLASNSYWQQSSTPDAVGYNLSENNKTGFNCYPTGYYMTNYGVISPYSDAQLWMVRTSIFPNGGYGGLVLASSYKQAQISNTDSTMYHPLRCISNLTPIEFRNWYIEQYGSLQHTLAETNVQSDWNQSDNTADDYIKNKPTLGTAAALDVPSSGNASSTQVVKGDDTRLSDARPASDVSAWAKAANKPSYTPNEVGAIPATEKGANNGVAELDENGKVPSSQLPAFVDDVVEAYYDAVTDRFYEESTFTTVITPASGKSWVDIPANKSYRWTGSVYVRVDEGVQLGETSSTAYRGDKGKANEDAIAAIKDGTSIDSFGDVETALTDKISKSSTAGLVKNDGTIDTNTYLTQHQDISGKADKVSNATSGNFAGLDSNGNLTDSGSKASDFLTQHQDISDKEDKSNKVTSLSSESTDTQYPSAKCTYDLIKALQNVIADISNYAEGYIRIAGSSSPALSYKSYRYPEMEDFNRKSVFSIFHPCLVGTKLTGDNTQVGKILYVLKKLDIYHDIDGNARAIDGSEGDVYVCNIVPYYRIMGKYTVNNVEYDVFLMSRSYFIWQGIESEKVEKYGIAPDYCVSHTDSDNVVRMHSVYNPAWEGSYSEPDGVVGKYIFGTDSETGDITEEYDANATLLGGSGGLHSTDISLPNGEQRAMNHNPDTTKCVPFMNQTAEMCNNMQALLLSEGGTFDAHNASLMGSGFTSNDAATAAADWEESGSGAKNGMRVQDKDGTWKYYSLGGNVRFLFGESSGTRYAANCINSWRNPWHIMEAHRAVCHAVQNGVHELEWFVFEGNKYKYRSVTGFSGPSQGEMTCVVWKLMSTKAGANAVDPTDLTTSIAGNRVEILVSTAMLHGVTTQASPLWWVSGLIFTEDENGSYKAYMQRDQANLIKSETGEISAESSYDFETLYTQIGEIITNGSGYAKNYLNGALMMPDTNANKSGGGLHTYVGKYNYISGTEASAGKKLVRGFLRGYRAYGAFVSPLCVGASGAPADTRTYLGFGTVVRIV